MLDYDILIYFDVVIVHIHEYYHVECLICLLKLEFVNLMNYVHFLIDVIFLLNDPNSKQNKRINIIKHLDQ
jgi:hypothetical protein